MRAVAFDKTAFDDFVAWRQTSEDIFLRLVRMINETRRTPFTGIGKPEPLKGNYRGFWSRRITQEHRLIYYVTEQEIRIASCKGHYD